MDIESYLAVAGCLYFGCQIAYLRFKNEARFWYWLINTEKRYRNEKSQNGYPRDWQFRRVAVFRRDKGKCGFCGNKNGRLRLWSRSIEESGLSNNANLHVHHITPISQGGSHNLYNLKILCAGCHAQQHPGNSFFIKSR